MSTVTIDIAQAHLSDLIEDAIHGKEIVITKDGKPLVKLVPFSQPKQRPIFGSAKGLISMSDDFDAPLEDFGDYTS
ncbi:MAG: type II toxin-antitoxin system Phd/YefM family antitoxin [Deltaproteobacteria bacterium]|nr:type II toxin-antitoxin system Phd/YefM family antitoxin [Deltaproteobacteria bacterium]